MRTPDLCLPDPLDEVPGDCHGTSGPAVETLREKWTGKSPQSVKAATKSREEAEEARQRVRKAAAELRAAYVNRNGSRGQ